MVFCTEGFDRLAALMLDGLADDVVSIVRLPHPLADRSEADVRTLVEQHADDVLARLHR